MKEEEAKDRPSAVFARVARHLEVGDDVLPTAKRTKNQAGRRGVPLFTIQRWERFGWVVLLVEKDGNRRNVVGAILTPKGVDARDRKVAAQEAAAARP